ncbi:hypothetical protein FAVG1_03210 [Fusarium avenaceum]|nr:hypothetical protein FAVG1_03210 [Fusarium avenaceum]
MWLSRGLVASTLILAAKAQDVNDGIDEAALHIATGFAETLIQHAVTTLNGDAGGAGGAADGGNQDQVFDATLLDKPQGAADNAATVTQMIQGQLTVETYTRPGGVMFPVTLLPHPKITIAPHSGDPYERIIQAYTGGADATTNQEITIAEPSGTKPGTVIVDVPGTAYSSFSSGQPGALTIPPSNDNPTATIISALPSGVAINGDATRTIPAAGNAPATVVIQTPWADVPPNTAAAGGGVGGGVGGNAAGSTSNVLVIQTYTGTEYITQARVTTIAGNGGDQGTVLVQVPQGNQNPGGAVTIPPSGDSHFTTIVRQYTGPTPISTPVTILVPTSAGQDGTIIIETPGASSTSGSGGDQGGDLPENQPQVIPPSGDSPYSTILRPHAGSDQITAPVTYTIQPSGTNPGTVIIETPAVRAGQQVITLPSDPDSGYITIIRQPTGAITAPTTITIPPSGGQPGTIVIETPAPQPGDVEITIPAGADGSYVTVIRGPTGSNAVTAPTTITVTGAPGQPGTIIINTPVPSGGAQTTRAPGDPFTITPAPGGQYVTIFRPHSGDPISVPITLTQGGQNGQPGTVIIETPAPNTSGTGGGSITIPAGGGSPYVTVYRPHSGSPIDKPITVTVPPNGNQPGTIIIETPVPTIETPKGQNAVTSAETGGQQITIPPSKNNPYVTIYRPHTGDPITVPITITQTPSNGQPGTIIIETPAPPAQTVTEVQTQPGATVTVQPDTPGGYTTIYRPHTGDPISEPITVTTISGSNGQPGTVIIETQGPITITPTVAGGTATIYTPGSDVSTTITKTVVSTAPAGEQTTVIIIETPPVKVQSTSPPQASTGPDGMATVIEEYTGTSIITAIFTTTVRGSGTNPGTVYIETPPPVKFVPTTSVAGTTVSGNDNYVTVFKPFPGPGVITAPFTITEATPSGGQPGTVVIQTPVAENPTTSLPAPSTTQGPDGYMTVFLPFPGPGVITQPYTRTQAPSGGNPGTVFITTPAPVATTTTPLPAPSTTQGSDGYVTVYLPFPGPGVITQPYTRTQAPSGGNPGTVFITTPAPMPATTAQENLPSTTSGTDGYVTVFIPYPGPGEITAPITSTQPPSGGRPGTVFITTPGQPAFTTPKQQNGLTSSASGNDGYITVFLPYTGVGEITAPITSTQPPSNGQPGTVFITTPGQPAFTTPKQQNGLTSTSSGADGYVTVFLPYTGVGEITAPITSTQLPTNGQPGTVFITTPGQPALTTPKQQNGLTSTSSGVDGYVTVFLPFPGPGVITEPITSTQPPSGGNPGTVYITTPAPASTPQQNVPSTTAGSDDYVTVFFPFPGPGVITAPITRTQVAPSGGNPGTVFITTPASGSSTPTQTSALTTDNYITIYTPFPGPGVITAPFTITKPPSSGQPGTVLIQTPAPVSSNTDTYVTVYRPYPGPGTITAPITLTQAPVNGQPGTVFIETQATNTPTSTTQTSDNSTPPITIPPEPTGSYVTIYRPYPGPGQITSPVTYTQAPVSGKAGTIIIETPNSDANTATQTGPVTVPTGNNNPYVTVYKPYPGPGNIDKPITITAATPSGDQPGTIIIETPTPDVNTKFAPSATTSPPVTIPADNNNYVTVYTPHTGSPITAPITVTTIAPTGGQPGTVIIETPGPEPQSQSQPTTSDSPPLTIPQGQDGYVTVYRPYPGPGSITEPVTVTTIAPTNGQPGTVIIETPAPAVETSSAGSSSVEAQTTASAVTIPADNGGYVTVYRPYPGPGKITAPRTIGTVAPSNGQPGTIIIETPAPEATAAETTSVPAVTTSQGNDGYITVFQPYTGTGVITEPTTISTVAPSNGQPGTYIVATPASMVPTSTQASNDVPVTIPPGPGNSYVTVYRPHTGADTITAPITVTTIEGVNGQPGTIIVETPAAQAPTTTGQSDQAPVTIPPGPENSYVTVYRPYTGVGVITVPVTVTTIAGVNGQPGTIVIETPVAQAPTTSEQSGQAPVTMPPGPDNSYVTVYRPYTGTEVISAPVTVTTIPGVNGQPGTVIIETPTPVAQDTNAPSTAAAGPGGPYVTVYRPYTGTAVIAGPVTVTTIPGVNGQPGTVIIETPTPATQDTNAPSTAPAGPVGTYVTVYRPYPGPGNINEPITVTTIEPSNGTPGTIIIETPGIETGGKVVIPPVTLDPAPGGQYVTVYRPHTGTDVITAPVTITTIAPSGGQPGTVVIETPEPETSGPNPTVTLPPGPNESYVTVFRPHTGADVITGPVTVTTIAPINGQPGTVIIETPAESRPASTPAPADSATTAAPQATPSYITVYRPHSGSDRITVPVTVTTIEASGGQPGTIIIETPDQDLPPMTTSAGPAATYVTVYRPHTGADRITEPVTITTIEPTDGQPGTVIIETPGQQAPPVTSTPIPASYITITRLYTGTDQITEPMTTTVPPQGDQPGTVIVETPGQQAPLVTSTPVSASYITITRIYTGTGQIAEPITTTVPPQGDQPGTVIVEAPGQQQPPLTSTTASPSYVTVTRPYPGADQITTPVVTTVPPQGDQPGTVIVETQAPFVTVYRPHTGPDQITGPVTVSTIAPTGDQPGTIVIETPGVAPAVTTTPPAPSYITITTLYTGTEMLTEPTTVTTIPAQGDVPGTIIVQTQGPYVTISTLYTGTGILTAPTALTTIPPRGDQPGTVIFGTAGSYVTITTLYTGTDTLTGPTALTTIPPQGNQPGTVIIATPASYVTNTIPYTGTDQITAPITATINAPSGVQPGTVVIETQAPFVTIYRPHTGADRITTPVTIRTIAPTGDQPGTVVIETPGSELPVTTTPPVPSYNTVYEEYSGTDDITEAKPKTTIEPQGDQPGTIVFNTPAQRVVSTGSAQASYVTVYRPHTGTDRITAPATVTTIAPQGDQPGTVIIETPGSEPPITSNPEPQPSYVTVYQPHSGTGRITEPVTLTTIPPQGNEPGTVVIETPGSEPAVTSTPAREPSYVTVYQPHAGTGRITEPITLSTVPPQGDQPGTVFIETPGVEPPMTSAPAPESSYVTVYRPHTGLDRITEPVTVTTIAPQGDQPGTVIIETPGSEPPVTSSPAPEPSYVTVYRPHTGADHLTGPVTITTIAPSGDQPGTVIIETSGYEPPVTSTPAPTEAPEPSYATVYRPHTGVDRITAPVTITTIEPQGGQPGTVIIETPGSEPAITSMPAAEPSYVTIYRPYTGSGRITAPVTITTVEAQGDVPGTVIVETPGSEAPVTSSPIAGPEPSYVTVYRPHTGADRITAPATITTIEPQGGQPGTVIIETPGSDTPMTSTPTPAPQPTYVTVYRPHAGSDRITAPVTVTTIEPQGDQPGTVIIETPGSEPAITSSPAPTPVPTYVTIYRPHTGADRLTAPVTVTTVEPQGGQPGTVIIETPGSEPAVTSTPVASYTTIYEPYTGTGEIAGEITRTAAPPQGDQPGTVIIETPGPQTAIKGANPPLTISAGDDSYVTVFRPHTGVPQITAPITITTVAPSGGQPGTVIIETPVPESETSSAGSPPITLPPGDDRYVTIFRPHTGTGGQPGTVIIETPEPMTEAAPTTAAHQDVYVTIFRPYTGTGQITAPLTVTTIAPVSGTGTVIIETLSPQTASIVYVTVYRPYTGTQHITEPTTVTTIAPVSGTGTVIIETPTPEPTTDLPSTSAAITIPSNDENRNVTVIKAYPGPGTITAPITKYVPPTAAGEPGTVVIETQTEEATTDARPENQPTSAAHVTIPPSDNSPNTTIVRQYPGPGIITAPITSYEPPKTPGQPGTVIIETPAPVPEPSSEPAGNNVTLYTLAPPGVKVPITSYAPPQTRGQPGTVFIQTVASDSAVSADAGRNVTISREGPTAFTTYSPPGTPGDPGTVIVEYLAQTNVTITRQGSVGLTTPFTTYMPPRTAGEPGTVIVETPEARGSSATSDEAVTIPAHSGSPNVTVIRGGPGREASTIYIPPTGTEPGTIIIETPTTAPTTSEGSPTSEIQLSSKDPAVTIPPSSNSPNITVIRPYPGPGSITEPVTKYVPATVPGEPGTIIIETQSSDSPASTTANAEITLPPTSQSPNVTVIRPYPGPGSITEPVTRYEPPTAAGAPGTIIIETQTTDPTREAPKTSSEDQTTTKPAGITIPANSGSPNVTVIRQYTGPGKIDTPITSYIPPAQPGEPGTVVIETPAPVTSKSPSESQEQSSTGPAYVSAVPTTEDVSGKLRGTSSPMSSNPDALTLTPSDGNDDFTIVQPNTKFADATENVTQIVPPSNGTPGTQIIYTPVDTSAGSSLAAPDTDSYVTISATVTIPGDPSTRAGPKSNTGNGPGTTGAETNVIIIPPSGTEPGTVLSQTSVYLDHTLAEHGNVTITRPAPSGVTTRLTTYMPPAQSTDPGTIVVEVPEYNVTITRAALADVTTTLTTYSPPATAGDPGTIIIETPDYNVTITREAPASITSLRTSYKPPGTPGDPGTVIVETPNKDYNVTITRAGPASVTSVHTTYAPPAASGDPGTIIVETPDYNVTVTRGASITAPFTTYSPPATPGDPGTVIVETPDYNVTITTDAPRTVTTLRSTYIPPGKAGDPGTVVIETPLGPYNVTTTRGASITAPFTTYSPPGSPGDPGTIIVETPDYNVTITRQAPKTATAPFSIYSPPGSPGDPGTVFVETPISPYNVTTTRGASTITTPFTRYSPPGEAGDPGTIIVETPDYNVTITRQAPKSVTTLFSTYSPPGRPGDPGTVIIETPIGAYNVTTTRGASTITAPFTTYSPPGDAGDPGTVIVETPEYNVTVTSMATDSVTDVVTRYNPPATPGDPGTVAIIMPNQRVVSTSQAPSKLDNSAYNVTITSEATEASVTDTITRYNPPATPGDPGTVAIIVPNQRVVSTSQASSKLDKPAYNVTITSEATEASITGTVTRYNPPATPGDPGTVAIVIPNQRVVSTSADISNNDKSAYNVTITSEDVGSSVTAPVTRYNPPATPGDPGTVAVIMPNQRVASSSRQPSTTDEPAYNVTIYRPGPRTLTGPVTSYIPPASRGANGTIIIETRGPATPFNVTITQTVSTITAIYTTYSPAGAEDDPGTVVVEIPAGRNVTITEEISSITAPFTSYSPPGASGDPGTVVIGMPADRNVTITSIATTRTAAFTTYSSPANRGDPGTVIIELPPDSNVTTTKTVSDRTAPYTTYSAPANRGDPGTIIIEVPPERNVTVTEVDSSITSPYTRYSPPSNQGDPGTVYIGLHPDSNITITTEVASRTAPYTTYSPPANKGDPGTVIVELPPQLNVTVTEVASSITSPYTRYSAPASQGDPGTVYIGLRPDSNVTITTEVNSRTAPYTTYSPPANRGDPGTIVVELPPRSNVTITKEVSSRTAAFTTYSAPASRGDPGTVIVELPPDSNTTITTEVASRTAAYTTFITPANKGDAGTVLVELPSDRNVTITTEVASLTAAYTTFAKPASKGDPGTIIVALPPDRNVTITTEVPTLTAPHTTYSAPGAKGDPGTVIVQMPPDHNVTITTEVASRTAPYTTYSAPGSKGDPGTIIIEMPPDRNVTTTEQVPTLTRAYTTYSPPGNRGDPGTVIVRLPPDRNVTVTTQIDTLTAPYTIYSPPANRGDPGTIIVELPPDRNITTTQEVRTITRVITTYLPPANQGDPGTVIVQEPPETNTTIVEVITTISRPATRFVPPATKGDPGTVYIDVPPNHNVTMTTTVSTITRPTTAFESPATEGDAGTVLVKMPPEYNITSTQTVQTISRPATRYSTPAEIGDPGTVYLDLPPEYNVTVTTTIYSITRQSTTFAPAATQGDPGTVIIEMPPEHNVTTTQTVQTISRPVTRYSKPDTIGDPGTIYVDLPPEYNVTVTTTVPTITRMSTTFAPAAAQGDPGTVIIEMPPDTNVTTTQTVQTISRPVTRYSKPGTVGDPGTVYVDLPPQYNVTVTTTVATITRPLTTFAPAGTQGDPGTVIVELPPDSNVTITQTISTISRPMTRFSPAGTVGDPGTVYVDLPPQYNVTVTSTIATITKASTTFASAGTQGDPGTIIVELPPDSNVTVSSTIPTITRPATRFVTPASAGDPGTVYVDLPPEYNVTTTQTISSINRVRTTYNPASTQGEPGTILIQVPPEYNVTATTTVTTISRVMTTFAPGATQGDPGTILVEVPVEYNVTRTETVSSINRVRTTYNPAGTQGDPNTVLIQVPPNYNVTTTQTVSSISRVTTTYLAAATQGDPNTVLIQVPPNYNVTTTQTVSSISRVSTTYMPAATQGDPNTVLVQVPPDYNVTTTQTISTINRVRTTYMPAGTQGDPNTVLVQVPPDYNVTTTQTISTINRVRTTYMPAATQGDPNTVLVQVPPDYNVTTTQTISTINRVRTTYLPAGIQGDPNTVLVQVPVDYNVTTTQTVSTISRVQTAYNPGATQGDPGTVLVLVPMAYNVTTTQTVPTVSRVQTAYNPGATQGDPGTVLVLVPMAYNVTTTQTVGTISRIQTTYNPGATQGDPGTVLVLVPMAYNVTTTQTVPTISRVQTAYNPGATQGDPGTIVVQVPVEYTVTTTQTVSTITRARTTYNPAGVQGDPNTVLVQVPVDYNVTTTQTVPTISRVQTKFNPGVTQGDPGTVLVQIPPEYNVTTTQTVSAINQIMTSFAPAATQGDPGTIIIQVPPPVPSVALPITSAVISSSAVVQAISTSTSSKMPQASFGPTFDCDGYGYVISTLLGNTLTRVNLIDGSRSVVKSGIGPGGSLLNLAGAAGAINAIGFNTLDNYIYGVLNQGIVGGILSTVLGGPKSQIIRIAKNGAYEALSLTIPSNMIDMGDVDDQGRFWVSESGKKWWCIDVKPGSSTYGKLLSSGTSATDILSGVGDWAFVPNGGNYLYAIQASIIESGLMRTNIVRWSLTTNTWERYQSYPSLVLTALNLVWGAVMAGPGVIYAQENLLGQTWKFQLGSSGNPTSIPGGAILNLQGDGARCPSATTIFGPPFDCNGNGYVVSTLLGNTLTQVNLNDGTRSVVASGLGPGGAIDGIGYNQIDNYIYGVVGQNLITGVLSSPQSQLIRIAKNGAYEVLSLTIPSSTITMGDVDSQGRLWVSESGKKWWCIDVNPSSSTFNTILNSGTSSGLGLISGVGDWAYVAGGGNYLYAVQASIIESGLMRTNIVRWSLSTQTWERFQSYPSLVLTSLNLVWGAVMAGPNGVLYAQENLLGQTWKFTLGSSTNPTSIPGGAILNLAGDGSRCIGQDPTNINISPPSTTAAPLLPSTSVSLLPSRTITITTTVATISKLTTTLKAPAILGDPATVLVQYPIPSTITTTQTVSTITRPTTVLASGVNPGDPNTVIVQYPIPSTITTTQTVATITRPTTVLVPGLNPGDPNTVIVQYPIPSTITTTQTVSTITRPTTVLASGVNAGDPNTIIVKLPTPYNVTTTQTVPTITRVTTAFVSGVNPGDPCTVIVQYPTPYNVTITTDGGTSINAPVTSYLPPGQAGDPGTVVVATPASRTSSIAIATHSGAGPAFKCDVYGYLMQKTALYRVDISTGKTTLIDDTVGPGGWMNAIGYNRFDNYIYGMLMDNSGTQLIRISGDGSYQLLAARTSDRTINMGDIDNQGRYWISNQGKAWWCIDLMPGSAKYGQIIMSGTATNALNAADWAFVPGAGDYMYAVMYDSNGATSTLCRFSRTTYTWTTVKAYGDVTGNNLWGAVYASQDGSLYGSENSNGQIYKFPIAPTIGNPIFIAQGPVSSWNDGARCIDSQTLPS